jgi:hypothetical protein
MKMGYISMHKKGFKRDPNNYRISMISIISWLYRRILSDLIEKEYGNLEEEQNGFRTWKDLKVQTIYPV